MSVIRGDLPPDVCDECRRTGDVIEVYMRVDGKATQYEQRFTRLCAECRERLRGSWKHAHRS